jgi:hypothetical protein
MPMVRAEMPVGVDNGISARSAGLMADAALF